MGHPAGGLGTLGYALRLRTRTIPVERAVELLDGVAFGRGDMVLSTGRFVEGPVLERLHL